MVWVVLVAGGLRGVYSCAVDAHLQAKSHDGTVIQCALNSEVDSTKMICIINDAVDSGIYGR